MEPIQRKKPWYSRCYDSIVHWIEDTYLKLFGENRTSYGVKNTLRKTEVTGNKDIDGVQRRAGDLAGNTVKTDRVGGPVGDAVDKKVLRGNV